MNDEIKPEREHSTSEDKLESFSDRLNSAVGSRSARSVALECGMSPNVVTKYLNGESSPNVERLVAIAKALGVTVEWLATGEGRKHYPGTVIISPDYYHVEETVDDFEYISLYDVEASAGHGAWNSNENELHRLAFRKDWLIDEGLVPTMLAAIMARGDSMEPFIKSGDTLLVDLSDSSPVEGVYVLKVDGSLIVKRIQRLMDKTIRVKSDNPSYDPVDIELSRFNDPEQHDYSIVGKVVWSGRRI